MPRRVRPRLLILVSLLVASVALLFRPVSEPVTRVALWSVVSQPADAARCPAPDIRAAGWEVRVGGDFPWLDRALIAALGETCRGDCPARVIARLDPVWIDEPHFLSGFGRLDVPVTLDRTVGACRDAFRLSLDLTVDEGVRGSPRLAQLHAGQLIGGYFRNLFDGAQGWPARRPQAGAVD